MTAADDYILGNGALHDRFCVTTEILGHLVSCAPRPIKISQLESRTGRSAKELSKLCAGLARAGLLHPHETLRDGWLLACEPSAVTLEDVFRCVIAEQAERNKSTKPVPESNPANNDRVHHDVDLLIVQATMTINQSVFKQLRRFSLDRLKISAAGMFPSNRDKETPRNPCYDGISTLSYAPLSFS